MPVLRRVVRLVVVLAVICYCGAVVYLLANERNLVFHPSERRVSSPAAEFALHQQPIAFNSGDSTHLTAWIIPAANADTATAPWMVICHGNYGNIGYGGRPRFYASMRNLGVNLLAFDYRGFGASDGTPGEQGLYMDARAAYNWLRREKHIPPERIIIFGHSLGSGVATELAARVPSAGLIVEGAFTSVPDRGQELYPIFPVKLVARNRFASIEKVPSIHVPKLFLHARDDAVIPFAHGQTLFAAASEPKTFVEVHGGHEDAYRIDHDRYYGAIREFIGHNIPDTPSLPVATRAIVPDSVSH